MFPRSLAFVGFILGLWACGELGMAQEPGFFSNVVVGSAPPSGFTTAPVLDDSATSAANVTTVLGAAPPPAAVQVRMQLGSSQARAVFTNPGLKYVLTEFNAFGSDLQTKSVADAVLASATSAGAFVGNFNLYPNIYPDPTRPGSQFANYKGLSFAAARGHVGAKLGAQFAAPALFPGSVDYRGPAMGNSSAPNIRSALFILPIVRLTLAELGLRGLTEPPADASAYAIAASPDDPDQRLIPWVCRFNNLQNATLGGGPYGNGFVQNSATPSNGQLPSRGDFQAQILHYRLRGADDLALFGATNNTAGVVGYSNTQAQSDMALGWAASPVASEITGRRKYAFANLSNSTADAVDNNANPVVRDSELAGAVWSGVYDRAGAADQNGQRRMVILISNLSAVKKSIELPSIEGFAIEHPTSVDEPRPGSFAVSAGSHLLLEFALQPKAGNAMAWTLTANNFIGLDNNRNGVGVSTDFPGTNIEVAVDSDVCHDSVGNVASVSPPAGDTVYHWAIYGGTIQGGQGTPTITYSVASPGHILVALTAISTDAQQVEKVYEGASEVSVGPPSDITVAPVVLPSSQGNSATGPARDGLALTYEWSISGDGALTSDNTSRTVQFTAGASGSITLMLKVTSLVCSNTSTAEIAIDQPPVATNDRALTSANHPVDIAVLANDQDPDAGDTLTLSIEAQPATGSVMLINNGTAIRYTPAPGALQNDSFMYRITDSHGAFAIGTVTIGDLLVATLGEYHGLVLPAAGTPSEFARNGYARIAVARNGVFTGYLTLAGVRHYLMGTFDQNGAAQFKPALSPSFTYQRRAGETPLMLTLQLGPGGDSDQIRGTLTNGGAPFAELEVDRIVSTATPDSYTYSYLAQPAPNRTVPLAKFPQGDGYSSGTVSSRGLTVVQGRLADLAPVVVVDTLTKGNRLPFYMPLYGGLGSLSGWINYRDVQGASDADAPQLSWFRPPVPLAAVYKEGWPGGIDVEFRGSVFKTQGAQSALPGLGADDADGNAELMLRSGGISEAGVFDALTISPANRVVKVGANPRQLRNFVLSSIGRFNAFFHVPGDTADRLLYGTVLQKTKTIRGFYIGKDGLTGLVTVAPKDQPRQSP